MRPFETIDQKLRDVTSCKAMSKTLSISISKRHKSEHTSHVTSTILAQAIAPPLRFEGGFKEGIFASIVFEHAENRKRQYPNTIDIENL